MDVHRPIWLHFKKQSYSTPDRIISAKYQHAVITKSEVYLWGRKEIITLQTKESTLMMMALHKEKQLMKHELTIKQHLFKILQALPTKLGWNWLS